MFNSKRWWIGYVLGTLFALAVLITIAMFAVQGNSERAVAWLLMFLFGGIASYVACWYTGFGKGRREFSNYNSPNNPYCVVFVPPHPLLGGTVTGYAAVVFLAGVSVLIWGFFQ